MTDEREVRNIGLNCGEFIGKMLFMAVMMCIVGYLVTFAYEKTTEPTRYGRGYASDMREISDSILATRNVFDKEIAEPGFEMINHWTKYSRLLKQFTQEEASVVAGILCDICQYSYYKRTEYSLVTEQSLGEEQVKFFVSKGYDIDVENGIIKW